MKKRDLRLCPAIYPRPFVISVEKQIDTPKCAHYSLSLSLALAVLGGLLVISSLPSLSPPIIIYVFPTLPAFPCLSLLRKEEEEAEVPFSPLSLLSSDLYICERTRKNTDREGRGDDEVLGPSYTREEMMNMKDGKNP